MPILNYEPHGPDADGHMLYRPSINGLKTGTPLNWNPKDQSLPDDKRDLAVTVNTTATQMFRFMGSQATGGAILTVKYGEPDGTA